MRPVRASAAFVELYRGAPLHTIGDESVQQLRRVHVLNGKEVRSYAEEFIRRP